MKMIHDEENKRIDFLDERFYTKDDVTFYPSVTTVLGVYPKGHGYEEWLKQVGFNASEIVRRAGEQGSNIHDAIEKFYKGQEVCWAQGGEAIYTEEEWRMILRFFDFHSEFVQSIEAVEHNIVDDTLKIGGTMDLVCQINGERWLIDFKSGNAIYKTAYMQLACYADMWDRESKNKIDKVGIMHLRTIHRGRDSRGKSIQGEKWKLYEVEDREKWFRLYEHSRAIWDEENPTPAPKNMTVPDRIKLKTTK